MTHTEHVRELHGSIVKNNRQIWNPKLRNIGDKRMEQLMRAVRAGPVRGLPPPSFHSLLLRVGVLLHLLPFADDFPEWDELPAKEQRKRRPRYCGQIPFCRRDWLRFATVWLAHDRKLCWHTVLQIPTYIGTGTFRGVMLSGEMPPVGPPCRQRRILESCKKAARSVF